eukprot:4280656-Prymnesium_polylepis.1
MEEIRSRAETYGVHPKSDGHGDGVHGCTGSMMRNTQVRRGNQPTIVCEKGPPCVAASSERGSARRRTAGLENSERVTWAMGDAVGT